MPYTSEKPRLVPDSETLRSTIPGWGVDLDPNVRPGYPKEQFNPGATGAHWTFPERQIPAFKRERSPEHAFLTPVFGTTCPPKGLSGLIRRFAYRYSEGRAVHWTLLLFADRVDVVESNFMSLLRGKPDHFIREYGIRSEITGHGIRSRVGQHRADIKRIPMEFMVLAGTGIAAVTTIRAIARSRRAA